ncbi:Alpha/beta hydrolase family [Corynebacterium mustelae]|uniref:Alpha/beta hydrolase family n=1 Tax=Corynebacterium mustelae TaxID=571915 RepID=A0A0G3H2D0_9CORY|nr:alpha/beta hydrolase [Corynebacterium mustelae]AKK06910.1 Alpha/beta hydrolase family [Corynebacterium mustelae]
MPIVTLLPTRGTFPHSRPPQPDETPVVFIHGAIASPGNFAAPAAALIERGVPVFAPAYGNRGTNRLEKSLAELLTTIDSYVKQHEVSRIAIVGHSAGGLLGLRIACARPTLITTLVGLGACFRGVPYPTTSAFRRRIVTTITAAVAGPVFRDLFQPELLPVHLPPTTRITSIVSDADRYVPVESATLGNIRRVTGVRHELLPQLIEPVLTALDL